MKKPAIQLDEIKSKFDSAFDNVDNVNGSVSERLDQIEALISELAECIHQQTRTINTINKTHLLIFEEISNFDARLLLLEADKRNIFINSDN